MLDGLVWGCRRGHVAGSSGVSHWQEVSYGARGVSGGEVARRMLKGDDERRFDGDEGGGRSMAQLVVHMRQEGTGKVEPVYAVWTSGNEAIVSPFRDELAEGARRLECALKARLVGRGRGAQEAAEGVGGAE